MLQGLPPVSKVTFLNGFICVLKRWPVINSWLAIKGWNIGDSQCAPSLLSALALPVTNNETHRGTFVVFDYYLFSPTTSLLWCWHTNFVLVIIRPSSFKHHRADCLPENIPMATRHSPDHVCVSNSCHKQQFLLANLRGEKEYTLSCVYVSLIECYRGHSYLAQEWTLAHSLTYDMQVCMHWDKSGCSGSMHARVSELWERKRSYYL